MGASCLDTIQDDGKLFDKKIVLLITKNDVYNVFENKLQCMKGQLSRDFLLFNILFVLL